MPKVIDTQLVVLSTRPPTKKSKTPAAALNAGKRSQPKKPNLKVTKQATLIGLLKRKSGATIDDVKKATGWQAHSIRGAISGTLKAKLGLKVNSETVDGRGRVYRIAAGH
jgi:hypothetical protein